VGVKIGHTGISVESTSSYLKYVLLIEQSKSEQYRVLPERLLNQIETLHSEFYKVEICKGLTNRIRPGPGPKILGARQAVLVTAI
jgi:hypothetical protein